MLETRPKSNQPVYRRPIGRAILGWLGPLVDRKPKGETRRLKVMIAEDNRPNQMVIECLLGQAPVDCRFVDNGEQAVAAWEAEDWDLILMDVRMPVMDGVQATREIRRRELSCRRGRTPIHALTVDTLSHQAAAHRLAGMDGHFAKPIQLPLLFDLVAEIARLEEVGAMPQKSDACASVAKVA